MRQRLTFIFYLAAELATCCAAAAAAAAPAAFASVQRVVWVTLARIPQLTSCHLQPGITVRLHLGLLSFACTLIRPQTMTAVEAAEEQRSSRISGSGNLSQSHSEFHSKTQVHMELGTHPKRCDNSCLDTLTKIQHFLKKRIIFKSYLSVASYLICKLMIVNSKSITEHKNICYTYKQKYKNLFLPNFKNVNAD